VRISAAAPAARIRFCFDMGSVLDGKAESACGVRPTLGRIDDDMISIRSQNGNEPHAAGKVKRMVVPCPSSLSAEIRPPMAPTRCLTMASPRPVPPTSLAREESAR
jgi:hypothetical protein